MYEDTRIIGLSGSALGCLDKDQLRKDQQRIGFVNVRGRLFEVYTASSACLRCPQILGNNYNLGSSRGRTICLNIVLVKKKMHHMLWLSVDKREKAVDREITA